MARSIALMGLPVVLAAAVLANSAPAAPGAASGAQLYTRCAACHTANGAGVPGSFPPLRANFRGLAAQPQGRRYLQLAVIKGLNGQITIDGRTYRGMMPAQGLDDAGVASVLNHVGTSIATSGPAFRNFTASEVRAARSSGSALNAAGVARLRPAGGR